LDPADSTDDVSRDVKPEPSNYWEDLTEEKDSFDNDVERFGPLSAMSAAAAAAAKTKQDLVDSPVEYPDHDPCEGLPLIQVASGDFTSTLSPRDLEQAHSRCAQWNAESWWENKSEPQQAEWWEQKCAQKQSRQDALK